MLRIVPSDTDQTSARPAQRAVVGRYQAELLPRKAYVATYTPDAGVIGFAFESQTGIHAFASDRKTGFQTKPNSLAYVPAGCEVFSRSPAGGEYLTLKVARKPGDRWPAERRFNDVVDPAAIIAAQRLRGLLLAAGLPNPLAFERYARVLRERVAFVLGGAVVEPRAGAWMTTRRLRLIDEAIDDKLNTKLTVQELADVLGLSAGFFSRAFKAAVGKAPHEYIIDRRVARARALLHGTRLTLSTVALDSGFASHAHMTAVFRSHLGVTPSELRSL